MPMTLVLACSVPQGTFYAVAEGFPFVPRIGDHITVGRGITLQVEDANPKCHFVREHATFIYSRAHTASRTFTLEDIKGALIHNGWLVVSEIEAKKFAPFFWGD